MTPSLQTEFTCAQRCFAQASTAETREAVQRARGIDRAGELVRQLRLIEIGCLIREQQTQKAREDLRRMRPLTPHDEEFLYGLLATAPENMYPAFEEFCKRLRCTTLATPPADDPDSIPVSRDSLMTTQRDPPLAHASTAAKGLAVLGTPLSAAGLLEPFVPAHSGFMLWLSISGMVLGLGGCLLALHTKGRTWSWWIELVSGLVAFTGGAIKCILYLWAL